MPANPRIVQTLQSMHDPDLPTDEADLRRTHNDHVRSLRLPGDGHWGRRSNPLSSRTRGTLVTSPKVRFWFSAFGGSVRCEPVYPYGKLVTDIEQPRDREFPESSLTLNQRRIRVI